MLELQLRLNGALLMTHFIEPGGVWVWQNNTGCVVVGNYAITGMTFSTSGCLLASNENTDPHGVQISDNDWDDDDWDPDYEAAMR